MKMQKVKKSENKLIKKNNILIIVVRTHETFALTTLL